MAYASRKTGKMEPLLSAFHLLLSVLASLFVLSNCVQPVDLLSSCLIHHRVYNVSFHDRNPGLFFKLLEDSIQNLRFEGPLYPKPAAVVIPDSKDELTSSVVCCKNGSWGIRVRSGGHSYEGTSYVAYDGTPFVLIDIMNLDRISIDLDSETAWVEGGATLGQTYYAISEASRVHGFPAGACPTVGIGGHVSGGGFGFLFRKYGLAADNVVDALLVDAEGRLLDRESMGEEAFWAIRGGGGGSWGIVFAWRIRLVRVPQLVTGFIISRPGSESYVAKLVQKWQTVAPELDDEFHLTMVVGAGAEVTGISTTVKGLYLGQKQAAQSVLEDVFPEMGIMEWECKEMSWIESVHYLSGLENGSSVSTLTNRFLESRSYYKAKSDYVRTAISRTGITCAIDMLKKQPKGYAIFDPYGGAMTRIGSDSIPYPHRKGNLFLIQYVIEWAAEDDAEREGYIDWIRRLYAAMAPYVSSAPRAAYVNYMDFDLGVMNGSVPSGDAVERARAWGEKYFLQNYDRLVRAKTAIDPSNVFRHEQGIFPAYSPVGKAEA